MSPSPEARTSSRSSPASAARAVFISQRIAAARGKEYNLSVHATTLCGDAAATDSERQHMATITTADFKNGIGLRIKDKVVTIVEFQHVKPGKGAAFVRTKTKNVITGSVVETSYNPTAKFPQAFIERKDVTYSYEDGDLYHFMDNETYDDIPVNASDVPDNFKFCKENELCKLLSYKGKVFSVEIPNFIELEVTQTEPGVKGNTATNTLKPATVETGAEIRVPLFINEGDHIRIDTRTGEYMERV